MHPLFHIYLPFPFLYYFIYVQNSFKPNFKKIAILIFVFIILINVPQIVKNNMMNSFICESIQYRVHVDSPLMHHDTIINRLSLSFTTMLYYLKFFIIPFGYYSYFGYNEIPLPSLFSLANILSFFIYTSIFIWYSCVFQFGNKCF